MTLQWVKLDANHRNEISLLALRSECGWEGYGIYLAMLQAAMGARNNCLTSDERLLSICLAVDEHLLSKVLDKLQQVNLVREHDGELYFEELLAPAKHCQEMSEKCSKAGKKSAEIRATKQRSLNKTFNRALNRPEQNRLDKNRIDKKEDKIPPTPQWGELTEPLQRWVQFRKELKKPLTPSSIDQILKTYQNKPDYFSAAVSFTIGKGWQGLKHPSEVSTPQLNGSRPLTPAQEMLKLAAELEEKGL